MKIGIVNDSIMATEVLRRIIKSSPQHKHIWTAYDGAEAIMRCHQELPELILMDLLMPNMNGVEATRRIMKNTPCAILIVTASVTGNSSMVFEAMGVGALDAVATPILGTQDSSATGEELLRKIELISKLTGCYVKSSSNLTPRKNTKPLFKNHEPLMIAIGASTGGPQAITTILSNFPADFPATIMIIQHMDKKFTAGLISWLNQQVPMPVKMITEGQRPVKGTVLVPSTGNHLEITSKGTLSYTNVSEKNYYRPSVDIFFNSLTKYWHGEIIGVLLTGMGRDGAHGLLNLKNQGHHTIAQDKETSIVYGMPKAAVELNAVNEVLPLQVIGPKLHSLVEKKHAG